MSDKTAMWRSRVAAWRVEAARLVIVDGFKRVRIATDRGDATIWVRDPAPRLAARVASDHGWHCGVRYGVVGRTSSSTGAATIASG